MPRNFLIPGRLSRASVISLVIVLALLLSGFLFAQEDPYERGLKIIREEGASAGIEYFRSLTLQKDDPTSFFYYGWALWEDGYVEESEQVVLFLMPTLEQESVLAGHCHYLLGTIKRHYGDLALSKEHLSKAVTIYEAHNRPRLIFKSLCNLAAVEIRAKDYQSSHSLLAKSWRLKNQVEHLGYYYELKSRVAFGKGLYLAALDFSQQSFDEYERVNAKDKSVYARCTIAFFQLLVGFVDEGIEGTKAIDEVVYSSDRYAQLSYYNAINWMLIYRCSKEEYGHIEDNLVQHVRETNDTYLGELLEFVRKWKCEGE